MVHKLIISILLSLTVWTIARECLIPGLSLWRYFIFEWMVVTGIFVYKWLIALKFKKKPSKTN